MFYLITYIFWPHRAFLHLHCTSYKTLEDKKVLLCLLLLWFYRSERMDAIPPAASTWGTYSMVSVCRPAFMSPGRPGKAFLWRRASNQVTLGEIGESKEKPTREVRTSTTWNCFVFAARSPAVPRTREELILFRDCLIRAHP